SGVIAAMLQVVVQNIINVFIPSGSGQASAVMPIMAPLSDLLGVSRQTANLAFTFGDGYSNMIIPTGIFTISGLMGLPVDKWFKWISKLFIIYFCLELVMITGAVLLGL
ncbi:MAG: TIGR00366 family protein, partial [Firmicutes bacterium]|nr:TIGR00366 family protein [Bacillota bacterium]